MMSRVRVLRADIAAERGGAEAAYFAAPIPRLLHLRVGPGGADEGQLAAWASYAAHHGYGLRRWDLADPACGQLLPEALRAIFVDLARAGRLEACGDLIGYGALATMGGVLLGRGVRPPTLGGEQLAWHELVPLRGMVLVPWARARDIGKGEAVFVGLELVMASPGHPGLRHLLSALPSHLSGAPWAGPDALPTDHLTGAAVFNRALGGVYTLVPRRTLLGLNALDPQAAGGDRPVHVLLDGGPHRAGPPPPPRATGRGGPGEPPPPAAVARRAPDPLSAWAEPAIAFSQLQPPPLLRAAGAGCRSAPSWAQVARAPVPRRLHQIWFGDAAARPVERGRRWEAYAAAHGYRYRLWTERDLAEAAELMPAMNMQVLRRALDTQQRACAADVLRLSLLEREGGIYVDHDHDPPRGARGATLDMATLLPMRGLAVLTEDLGREVGTDGLFAGNSLLMAPPGHPVIAAAVAQLPGHFTGMRGGRRGIDPWRATGPLLLNRLLQGPVVVLPLNWAFQYGMYREPDAQPVPEVVPPPGP